MMFQEVVSLLENEKTTGTIKFWRVTEINEKQREFYTLGEPSQSGVRAVLDQGRIVNQSQLYMEVWVDKGAIQGAGTKIIFPDRDLKVQLAECIEQAKVSSEKAWMPPAPSNQYDLKPETCFTPMTEDFMGACDQVYKELTQAIEETPTGIFNSSELFCVYTESKVQASNSHKIENRRSRFYAEVCFSAQKGDDSQEFLVTEWAVHPSQLNFRQMCEESAIYAEALLNAESTPQNTYSVLLHSDVLNEVLHDLSSHLDARSKYYQMPFKPAGESLIPDFAGASFSLKWNPGRDWTMASRRDDGWGRSMPTLILASNNQVLANACSTQMSQYLGIPASTSAGCLDVEVPGKPVEALIHQQPTLEILQFSGLFTSSVDLTFSSEIRLAKLWSPDGSFVYLKGGSLSGSVNDHFKTVEFSEEQAVHNKYQKGGSLSYAGPAAALVHQVPVTA